MAHRRKLQRFGVLCAALAALLVLAGGLRALTLTSGRPLALDFSWLLRFDTYEGELRAEWLLVAVRLLVLIALVLAPLALIVALVDRRLRRRVLRGMVSVGMLLLLARAIQNAGRPPFEPQEPPVEESAIPQADALAGDTFSAPAGWVVWSVSGGIALLAIAVVGGGLWLLWRRHQPQPAPLELLAQEAGVALEALREGGDLRNIIIRCYAEMERVVATTRGVQRQDAMTAREFELQLQRLGLPQAPVRELVQLFEAARYGRRAPGELDEQRAIASLSAIVAACRGVR
ncbi:MAG TPA: DUF4129 domain-containing protein [Anaerolineae bacterium]|nr:DUF4129 domain-containing protein [Anaerolineae bacterium]